MIPERIERELGARVRRFTTVKACLLWYVEQRSRRTGRAIPIDAGGSPVSQDHVDQVNATYARIAGCLVTWDRENDREPNPLGTPAQTEQRIDQLAQWFRSSAERGQQSMADRLGLTILETSKVVGRVEHVLRRRMRAHGLLEEGC